MQAVSGFCSQIRRQYFKSKIRPDECVPAKYFHPGESKVLKIVKLSAFMTLYVK
nr:Uncharacterised protein [Klebsiella pneumoniae]